MFSHSGVVDARAKTDGYAASCGVVDIDFIDTDAVLGNHLQAWQSLINHGLCDGVVAAQQGIDLTDKLQHAGLTQGATLTQDVGSGAFKEVVVLTRTVLIGGRGQQDG